ncbi:growth-regulated alpha protein-like [Toxotes jaculatrix]|uniref:growth-regulated alpha protein-like n=1 Tax=Toxotes jaculatrix TaxID=941984 RepID=UPI001B3ABC00|nr:growth-regulated alpha protein-like [Toxotes jaculatrix]
MNIAIHFIVLLACTVLCSSTVIKSCQCLKTSRSVDVSTISDVKVYNVRPYCSKKEVIVTLKDQRSRCLDPQSKFTQAVVKTMQILRAQQALKMNTTVPKPTQ